LHSNLVHFCDQCSILKKVKDAFGVLIIMLGSSPTVSYQVTHSCTQCRILKKVKDTFGVPIITDIHEPHQAEAVAQVRWLDRNNCPGLLPRQRR